MRGMYSGLIRCRLAVDAIYACMHAQVTTYYIVHIIANLMLHIYISFILYIFIIIYNVYITYILFRCTFFLVLG